MSEGTGQMPPDAGDRLGEADMRKTLELAAAEACRRTHATCCWISAVTKDDAEVLAAYARRGVGARPTGTTWRIADVPPAQQAFLTRRRVSLTRADDPRLSETQRTCLHGSSDRTSLAIVPLLAGEDVVGLLELADSGSHDLTARLADLDALLQMAADLIQRRRQLAAAERRLADLAPILEADIVAKGRTADLEPALRDVEALESSGETMRALVELGDQVGRTSDPVALAGHVAERLLAVTGAICCEISLRERDGLRILVSLETRPDRHDSHAGETVDAADHAGVTEAVGQNALLVIEGPDDPRLTSHQRDMYDRRGFQSQLWIPLQVEDRLVGVIELFDDQRRDYAEYVDFARSVGQLVAEAFSNTLLLEDLDLRSREAELLNRMAALSTVSLDAGDIATATVDALAGLVAFDEVGVVVDGVAERRVLYSSLPEIDVWAEAMDALGLPEPLRRLEEERAIFVDLERESLLGSAPGGGADLCCALVVGLWFEERLGGALFLAARRGEAFSAGDRRLLARVSSQLALAFRNARLAETIKTMRVGHLEALTSAMNARDPYAIGHAARVAGYTLLLGRELRWPDERLPAITEAAFLHDVGRIGVADDVLFKPGRLSKSEMAEVRQHPVVGAGIIQPLFEAEMVLAVRHHHERWDGTGYPDGLAAERIPELARALCLVDSYDAMSCRRPHHKALTYDECTAELRRCAGRQFDPNLVAAFLRLLGRLGERRAFAHSAAVEAATRVDIAAIGRLTTTADEGSPDYARVADVLREVRDAHPPVRFLSALAPAHDGWATIVDSEKDPVSRSHIGERVEAGRALAGTPPAALDDQGVVLVLDGLGLGLNGMEDLVDDDGDRVGLVCAHIAPDDDWPGDLGWNMPEPGGTLASVIASATARSGRARVDAVTDGLTGLYNQRYFKQRLGEEVARAAERGRPLALLFCDLDHAKADDDRLDRPARDEALRSVADVVLRSVREVDLAAHYQRGEFAVVLVDATAQRAAEVAERIRSAVADLGLGDADRALSMSIGVAAYPRDTALSEELIDKAVWALHLARRQGRDRVIIFAPGMPGDAVVGAEGAEGSRPS